MRTSTVVSALSMLLFVGCLGPIIRPDDVYLRPGCSLNAYRNVTVVPLRYDPAGIELAVSNELAKIGFRLVSAEEVRSAEESERIATLVCFVKTSSYPVPAVGVEFHDLSRRKVFASRAIGNELHGLTADIARKALSPVALQYSGFDERAAMAPYSRGEVIHESREQLMEYLGKNGMNLDPLEGIWSDDTYTYEVGIVRDSLNGKRDFVAFVLTTSAATWIPGQVKAEFTRTSNPSAYRTSFYMRDHSKQSSVATLAGHRFTLTLVDNVRDSTFLMTFTKTYPAAQRADGVPPASGEARSDVPSVGTGFLVASDGLVATNFHVVDGIESIEVYFPSRETGFDANVMFKDKLNDIVLLKLQGFSLTKLSNEAIPYEIRGAGDVGLGGEAYTLGFPLSVVLGQSIKMSDGTVSALSGIDDDPRLFQVSCPVQPGNSGGPLFNKDGNVVGIVVSSLNASYFYERASIIPQNVNFAVKADYLRSLMAMSPGGKEALGRAGHLKGKSVEEQVKLVSPFIAAIRAR